METKERIIELLKSTKRSGVDKLIEYLETGRFFEAPASTKYHGCYAGGLAEHSLRVRDLLIGQKASLALDVVSSPGQKPLPIILGETINIATLLHDVCKIGAYLGDEKPYKWNKQQPKGHALLSIERIKEFIVLTELEEMMIKYHMNLYGCNEMYSDDDWQTGEYHLRGDHSKDKGMSKEDSQKLRYGKSLANAIFHNPIVKIMYFADEISTLEEKAKESKESEEQNV